MRAVPGSNCKFTPRNELARPFWNGAEECRDDNPVNDIPITIIQYSF